MVEFGIQGMRSYDRVAMIGVDVDITEPHSFYTAFGEPTKKHWAR